jgi:hypothetical protein
MRRGRTRCLSWARVEGLGVGQALRGLLCDRAVVVHLHLLAPLREIYNWLGGGERARARAG